MKTIRTTIAPPNFHYDFPHEKEKILFFDIETTGLSPKTSSIYLIGVLFYEKKEDCFVELQWFAERNKDEKAVLSSFLECLEQYSYLYHFNGKTFDIPYVLEKCSRYALPVSEHARNIFSDDSERLSIDILTKVRKLKRFLSLEKCSQKALEQFLGIFREDPFSGQDLISVYAQYTGMRLLAPDKAEMLERTLLLHNFEDVEMMLSVCSLLQYELLFQKDSPLFYQKTFLPAQRKQVKYDTDISNDPIVKIEDCCVLTITLPVSCSFPKQIKKHAEYPKNNTEEAIPPAELEIKEHEILLRIPVVLDTLKYFFDDYKNYYYLPAEDIAIHKSIAEFANKDHRKKATPKTCYTKKEGTFLPSLVPQKRKKETKNATLFLKEYGDKLAYYDLPKDYETSYSFWMEFLSEQIYCFYASKS